MTGDQRAYDAERAVQRSLSVVRIVTIALIALSTELIKLPVGAKLSHPGLEITLTVAAVWAIGLVVVQRRLPARSPAPLVVGVIDVALMWVLTLESAGPVSQAKKAFFLLPVAVAMTRSPRATAGWTLVAMAAVTSMTLGNHSAEGASGSAGVFAYAAFIGLVGLAATLLSVLLARERDHIAHLADHRRELLAWNLSADERTRQRLAYQLHDGPVQNLLALLRLQARAQRGDVKSLDASQQVLTDTVAELRTAIFDLHPHTLSHAGLTGALRTIADDAAHRAALQAQLDLDEGAAGEHDELIFSCARELIANVVRHAQARELRLSLRREQNHVLLEVADDGIGLPQIPASRPGNLGLSTMAERISAANGRLELTDTDGPGTTVRLALPTSGPA